MEDGAISEALANQSFENIVQVATATGPDRVIQDLKQRSQRSDASVAVTQYIRALFCALGPISREQDAPSISSSIDKSHSGAVLLRVFINFLNMVDSGVLEMDRKVVDCISFLVQEMDSIPWTWLPLICNVVLKHLGDASIGKEYHTLQVLPRCLTLIVHCVDKMVLSESAEDDEEGVISGLQYRDDFIEELIGLTWSTGLLSKIANMLRELPLETKHVEGILKKILGQMKHIEPQDLPSLVYQLLLLAAKGFKRVILDGIIGFFSRMQVKKDKGEANDLRASGRIYGRSPMDVMKQVEGTVVLHINFAVKQDSQLGQELLYLMKSRNQPLSPFMVSVLLSVARIQRFEQGCLEILKGAVCQAYRDLQHCSESVWASTILGAECSEKSVLMRESLLKTVKGSACGWDHIIPSVVKIGFMLIESAISGRPVISDDSLRWETLSGTQQLGVDVLIAAFKVHDMARDEIIEQSKCLIIGLRPQQSYPIIRMIAQLVESCPQLMLDYAARLKECLDYFSFLPTFSASAFVQAICPLFQLNRDVLDYSVLVLRKSMFSREAATRSTAVQGLLDLLVAEKKSSLLRGSESLNSSEASCSQSCSQQYNGRKDWGSGTGLLHELLGLFRRCFLQQASVREVLYRGLPRLLLVDPDAAETIFDLLWPHFCNFYVASEENKGSLKLSACVANHAGIVRVEEPLDHLLYCIHKLLVLQPQKGIVEQSAYAWTSFGFTLSQGHEVLRVSSGESLSVAFLKLREGIRQSSLSDFGLARSQESNSEGLDRDHHLEKARILLGVLEVLIDASISDARSSNSEAQATAVMKEILQYTTIYECVQKLLKRPGKNVGKVSNKLFTGARSKSKVQKEDTEQTSQSGKQNAFLAPPSLFEKRMPLLSSSSIAFLLQNVTSRFLHPSASSQGNAREKQEKAFITTFSLKACLNHLQGVDFEHSQSSEVSDNLRHIIGNDWRVIAEPLLKLLLAFQSTFIHGSQSTQKNKEKGPKGKKAAADEGTEGHNLIAIKCLDKLFNLARKTNCLSEIMEKLLEVIDGEDVEADKEFDQMLCQKVSSERQQEVKRIHRFLLKQGKPFLEELLGHSQFHEAEVFTGCILSLRTRLLPFLAKAHAAWSEQICKTHECKNSGVVRALLKLALSLNAPPNDLVLARDMASELLKVTGSEEVEGEDASEQFPVINSVSSNVAATVILQQVDNTIVDTEWLISKLKSQTKAKRHLDRLKLEEALHLRMEAAILVLSIFSEMTLSSTQAEHFLRVVVRTYKCLAAATRLCIAPKGYKQSLPSGIFQRLVEVTCKRLTRPLYAFVAIMQRDQQENVQAKRLANTIKRERTTIPNLIFYVEDYEKYLIQLSRLTKVNLMRHAKRSTARDFKIIESGKKTTEQEQQEINENGASDGSPVSEDSEEEHEEHEARKGQSPSQSPSLKGGVCSDNDDDVAPAAENGDESDEEPPPTVVRSSKNRSRRIVCDSDNSDGEDRSQKKQRVASQE